MVRGWSLQGDSATAVTRGGQSSAAVRDAPDATEQVTSRATPSRCSGQMRRDEPKSSPRRSYH
jgi:hypothetical protein